MVELFYEAFINYRFKFLKNNKKEILNIFKLILFLFYSFYL